MMLKRFAGLDPTRDKMKKSGKKGKLAASLKTWSEKKPDFKKPPVSEVVLSLQFEPIPQLDALQFGRLWERYSKKYPDSEIKSQLSSEEETFGGFRPPTLGFSVVEAPSPPRCWFKNKTGTELIQVQQDRFIFNWRQTLEKEEEYPRYEHVRSKFKSHLGKFNSFLKENKFASVVPVQCEVTYVNTLKPDGWKNHGQVAAVFAPWSGRHTDDFLPKPEDLQFRARYVLKAENGDPVGRLHISGEPRYRLDDNTPVYRLILTARGTPLKKTQKAAFEFFDFGRQNIIRGFTSFTTKKMHKIWERKDA